MLHTGIPNLDLILGGGIPEGDVLLVVGPAGSGKTTLGFQMAFHVAAEGRNAIYVSTLSESTSRLMNHMRPFEFFDESRIGKSIILLNGYPLIKGGLHQVTDALTREVREHQAALIVIDGLMTIRDLHPDTPELRTFVYELGATLSTLDCTTVLTSSGAICLDGEPFPEFTMSDGILELDRQDLGSRTIRTVRSAKMRGLTNLLGQHSMRIDRQGIALFPRIESIYKPADIGIGRERFSLGLPELDVMMQGGPPERSITLLAGALGTGKTLSCLQYLMTGVQRGEKGLFVTFRENIRQLFDKARAFDMDLEKAIHDGLVSILHRPPVDLDIDQVTWDIWREVQRFAPRRLALDSIADLESIMFEPQRHRGYMVALSGLLRNQGVTALMTKEVAQVVGPELDFSDTPLAVLSENLLLYRYVEFRGELFLILSIIKMRDSAHDHSIRQYVITQNGIKVLSSMETAEGVLTGIARLPSEMRVKRTRAGPAPARPPLPTRSSSPTLLSSAPPSTSLCWASRPSRCCATSNR